MIAFGVLLGLLIALFLFGFVGGVAGAVVGGGREDRPLIANAAIGLVGSLVGGTLWNALRGHGFDLTFGGFFASLIGAIVLLLIVNAWRRRSDLGRADHTP